MKVLRFQSRRGGPLTGKGYILKDNCIVIIITKAYKAKEHTLALALNKTRKFSPFSRLT